MSNRNYYYYATDLADRGQKGAVRWKNLAELYFGIFFLIKKKDKKIH